MGLLAKNGAGGRLKTHKINIGNHMFILGLPGNLSRDLPTTKIQHYIDLRDANLFSTDGVATIAGLMWDYKLPLWKHLGEQAGTLCLDIYVKRNPSDKPCGSLSCLEELAEEERKKTNDAYDFNFVFEDFKNIKINNSDWLEFKRPPFNGPQDSIAYYYLYPVDKYHHIKCIFKILFGAYKQERFPKEYKQSIDDMKRIVNSFQFLGNAHHAGEDSLPA